MYRVKFVGIFLALQYIFCVGLAYGQIISDDFSDNDLGWNVQSFAGLNGLNTSSFADFGFDYSAVGIPEAPNSPEASEPTVGLRLRTNLANLRRGAILADQVSAQLVDEAIAGDYRLEVDMWLNWAPDARLIGTTLHAGPFVGKDTEDNPAELLAPLSQGAGILVDSDGDCGNCDYILLKNEAELDLFSGQYAVGFFNSGEIRNQQGLDNTDVTPGDFNDDGFIDAADFTVWRDNDLGELDYEQWFANFGNEKLDFASSFPPFELIDAIGEDTQPIEDPVSFELFSQFEGAVGFQWVTITVDVLPEAPGKGDNGSVGTATFSITSSNTGETILIGTVDNSVTDDPLDGDAPDLEEPINAIDTGEGPVDLEGQVSLVLTDFFTGGPSDQELGFVLYDNLTITSLDGTGPASVPEPVGCSLLLTGMLCLMTQRKSR